MAFLTEATMSAGCSLRVAWRANALLQNFMMRVLSGFKKQPSGSARRCPSNGTSFFCLWNDSQHVGPKLS